MEERVPIAHAAMQLSMTYHQARNLVLSGGLAGGRDDFGRLYVNASAIRQVLQERRAKRGGRSRPPREPRY